MIKVIYKILYKLLKIGMCFLKNINLYTVKKDMECMEKIENYSRSPLYKEDTFWDIPISKIHYNLSIIIPVYNSEKYLNKCLDSICSQKTKYNYQIICVNDGSTDHSEDILNNYKKKFENFYIITQKNGGISNARNNGIKAASGEYLGFIDNDDWVTDDYVEKLLDRAYEKNADIVKCNHVNFSEKLNEITGIIRHEDDSIGKFGLNIMEFKGYIWGGIIKKSLFDNIRFPEGYWYEDIMMRFTLMRITKKFEYIDENLYYYLLHQTNSSKTLWKKDNIKTLDFYYLLINLCKINQDFGIANDYVFYNQLVYELGPNLWLRTRKMPRVFRHTLFLYASDMAKKYYQDNYNSFYFNNEYISKSLLDQNYLLWILSAFNVICKVHIDYVK